MTTFTDQPLEEQIAQWRAYLRRRQGVHSPDVEELEGHLRDQLATLTEAGLSGDEAFLRAARPRTFEQVCSLIAIALELFTPDECAAYARHCGYRATAQSKTL